MKKETIRDCFNLLEADYGKQTNQKRELWGKMFKSYSDKKLIDAVGEYINKGKFFPRISDIKEIINGSLADEAELAWLCLIEVMESEGYYQSVSFPKYPAIGAVIEGLGGWLYMCDMKIDEEKWVKKEFIKLYPIIKKRGQYPLKLTGRFELDNSNKGYTDESMIERCGRRLDGSKVNRKLIENKKE